jgi:hypothetical protein
MKFISKWALVLLPVLALATPAFAQAIITPPSLNDSEEPGSVIVFPKFVNAGPVIVDGISGIARTEIEVGVVCPPGVPITSPLCAEHVPYKIRFHWVCPAIENVNSNICRETDFEIVVSMNGKAVFSADGRQINSNSAIVPTPPCPRGYLIGWVENFNDVPIRFDGLIGNAVIRGPGVGAPGMSTAVSAYNAIPIQAVAGPELVGAPTVLGGDGALIFDGLGGHYKSITGSFYGDVRFDKTAPGAPLPDIQSRTTITFLTLDVRSNRPNNPTFVPLNFYNETSRLPSTTNVDFERLLSTSWEFVCWDQVALAPNPLNADEPFIHSSLTQAFMGTRKGIVIAGAPTGHGQTVKVENGAPGDDPVPPMTETPVTLIGLIETNEGIGDIANMWLNRKYFFNTVNDSVPVPTRFVP